MILSWFLSVCWLKYIVDAYSTSTMKGTVTKFIGSWKGCSTTGWEKQNYQWFKGITWNTSHEAEWIWNISENIHYRMAQPHQRSCIPWRVYFRVQYFSTHLKRLFSEWCSMKSTTHFKALKTGWGIWKGYKIEQSIFRRNPAAHHDFLSSRVNYARQKTTPLKVASNDW